MTGSVFLIFYALAGRHLLAGPSSACAAGADWGTNPPRTLTYSFLPPQATCQYTSGLTRRMNPDWVASLATELAVPAVVAGAGFGVALWRWRVDAPSSDSPRGNRHRFSRDVEFEDDRAVVGGIVWLYLWNMCANSAGKPFFCVQSGKAPVVTVEAGPLIVVP